MEPKVCGKCVYWTRNTPETNWGKCTVFDKLSLLDTKSCDNFMGEFTGVISQVKIDKIIPTCGQCVYWERNDMGADVGECTLLNEQHLFHSPGCDEFICMETGLAASKESDPNALNAHEPGAKLDAGKLPARLLQDFGPALLKICKICEYGAEKYSPHGWLKVDNAVERYQDAMWRHLMATDKIDPESGLPHMYHAAWNMLAILTLEEEEK